MAVNLLETLKKLEELLAQVDPESADEPDALEAYDWITAIQDARVLIKQALDEGPE